MISPEQIKFKLIKSWNSHCIQRAYLSGESIFPIIYKIPAINSSLLREDFSAVRSWIKSLTENSKENIGQGYEIHFQEITNRQLGRQLLPSQIVFSTREDALCFIDKEREYQVFCQLTNKVIHAEPLLKSWILNNPEQILPYEHKWSQLLAVCQFMKENPLPNCYIRELDIPDIDTKFIEQHKRILDTLFEYILPNQGIRQNAGERSAHYFEEKYGFKYDEPLIRFRIHSGSKIDDISLPLSAFSNLFPPCQHVFITENKINGLSFPLPENSIVVFGLGYGIQSLRDVSWLKEKEIIYWGDIDTHGFAILSQLRGYYSHVKSFLMDEITLFKFQHLWVTENATKRCLASLKNLISDEQALFQNLINNTWGETIRLEQERIGFKHVYESLSSLKIINP